MLPIRARGRERGDGDLSDGSECEEFQSEMTWIHSGVKVMFAEVQRAFSKLNLITSSDMLFGEERPRRKGY